MNELREEKFFITLFVYDFDASPRHHYVRHFVEGKWARDKAIRLGSRLNQAIRANKDYGHMRWLATHYGISGFVERVDGVFRQVLERIA